MTQPNLFPGLLDKRVEFFTEGDSVYCFHDGSVLEYASFKSWMIQKVFTHSENNPELVKEISRKPVVFTDPIKNYIYYCFGRLNNTADIDLDGSMNPELHVCLNNGEPLSDREVDILKNIVKPDKLISDEAFISDRTVNTHLYNIRHKSGLKSKPELVLEAKNEGII